jgi:trehalose 6-phosphate phosphatase
VALAVGGAISAYFQRSDLSVPPHLRTWDDVAILLDVDGTLLDIAPTPQEVCVPDSLRRTLAALSKRLGGALALVSGRALSDLDKLFAPLRLPTIGGHGAEMRPSAGGEAVAGRALPLDPDFKHALKDVAERHPGVLVEDKGYAVALHFRQAPREGLALAHEARRLCKDWGDPSIALLVGKAVIEIKGAGFDKGMAVRELMRHPPFAGRRPIFVGDDITDEDAFAVLPEFDGHAISVGRKLVGIDDVLQSPADVRQWLERLSGALVATS